MAHTLDLLWGLAIALWGAFALLALMLTGWLLYYLCAYALIPACMQLCYEGERGARRLYARFQQMLWRRRAMCIYQETLAAIDEVRREQVARVHMAAMILEHEDAAIRSPASSQQDERTASETTAVPEAVRER